MLSGSVTDENTHTVDYQNSERAKDDHRMKFILEKTKELIFQTVTKAFDGMEKLFISDTKSQQKNVFMDATNVSDAEKVCISDTKSQQKLAFMDSVDDSETPTTSTAHVILEHIMSTPLLTTILINTIVFAIRIIKTVLIK